MFMANFDLLLPITPAPSWSQHQNLGGPSPEALMVYSGFLGVGVLLLNISSYNSRQGWLLRCQEQAKEYANQQSIFYLVPLIHSFSCIDHY